MSETEIKLPEKTLKEHRKQCKKEAKTLLCYSLIGTMIPFLLGIIIQIYDYKSFSIKHLFSHGEFFLYSASLFTYVFYLSQKHKFIDQKLRISLIIPLIGIIIASVSYAQIINLEKSRFWVIILVSLLLFLISSITYYKSHYKSLLSDTFNMKPDLLNEPLREEKRLSDDFDSLENGGNNK